MGRRRQQRVAQAFPLAVQPRLLFAGGERQSLQRAGDQQGKGFQQALLFGDHQLAQVSRLHHHQPPGTGGAFQRQDLVGDAG